VATETYGPRTRLGPTSFVLIGLLVGAIAGFAVAWVIGGNPLSAANEVTYREVVVNSVSEPADQLCWADDPERRDSPQTCGQLWSGSAGGGGATCTTWVNSAPSGVSSSTRPITTVSPGSGT
jgi:hypothetical protein